MSDDRSTAELDAELAQPQRVVVPRWVQLVVLPLALLALWAIARAAGAVLLVFLVAGVLALMLNPLVKGVQRLHLPRPLAVCVVFLCFILALGGIVVALVNPVSRQVKSLQRDLPTFVKSANDGIAQAQDWLNKNGINVQIVQPGKNALQSIAGKVGKSSGSIVKFTGNLLQQVVTGALALILIVVLTIYMLLYSDRIGAAVRSVLPAGDGTPEDDYPLRAQAAVASYIRGQLLFSLIMGTSAGIALEIFGLLGIFPDGSRYALFFGVFYGLMELVPYIGPVLGALPPIIVALIDNPLIAIWVLVLFVVLQQLEGHIVAPQVFGKSLRINPLIVIGSLLLGGELYGLVGALLTLPIVAIVRETVLYLRRHLVLEPWGTPSAEEIEAGQATVARPGRLSAGPLLVRCPACETTADAGDRHCRSCGAALASSAGAAE